VELLLALDLGTTHLKVAAFTLEGHLYLVERTKTKTVDLGESRAIYDPEELWSEVSALITKLTARLSPDDQIVSLAAASMAEAGLFIDAQGKPLTPIMAWYDARGKEVMEDWYSRVSPEQCFAITGLNYNYIYSLFKMLWIKENQPELYNQAAHWLCVPDFINYRLTGELATDYSIAGRTLLFDIKERNWSKTLLELAGLDGTLLPPVAPSGTCIGRITKEAATQTGLPEGTPVALGGHDHICGALAAGVVEPGRVLDSMGTSESVVAVFDQLPKLEREAFSGFNAGCHVVPDLYYVQGSIHGSGKSVDWYVGEFASSLEDFLAEAKGASPGAQGLFYVPHLRGGGPPVRSPHSKACFVGLRDYHTRADFARSLQEGLCLEVNLVLQSMEQVLGREFGKIHAIGGGTRNELWLSLKSTISQKVVEVPQVEEATLLGAALLGGIGAGVFRSHKEASAAVYHLGRSYSPDPDLTGKYAEIYQTYLAIVPLVRELSSRI
jgi:xylulokinase